ncbi:HAD family hydrolase [Breznakiella homolactica]|uniref:HAD family hydrolase n=1 Tax=Breznakiella homolactica TaxID=2798577 RepID=A0A7T8B9T4_9SPIR|nr:HAD family hydrolase [Breznakiella homolactica]QQO08646.1 HAD family hydrolase [Breznakiella homolactica]
MKCYQLPEQIKALIFDMDMTLYTHAEYNRVQQEYPVQRLAELRGVSFEEMMKQLKEYRDEWSGNNGGKTLSMGNAFVAFGIPIEESVRWREELLEPADFLSEDRELQKTMEELSRTYSLGVVTNNPSLVARKTLAILGVMPFFSAVIGLDTCGVSKPHKAPFLKAAADLRAEPGACVSIGDRYDIDIALPLELGMGGILVDSVSDVYKLGPVLQNNKV